MACHEGREGARIEAHRLLTEIGDGGDPSARKRRERRIAGDTVEAVAAQHIAEVLRKEEEPRKVADNRAPTGVADTRPLAIVRRRVLAARSGASTGSSLRHGARLPSKGETPRRSSRCRPWDVHDLRRTMRTRWARVGGRPSVPDEPASYGARIASRASSWKSIASSIRLFRVEALRVARAKESLRAAWSRNPTASG